MEMIKKEWKEVFKNKMLTLSIVVLCCIPIIYASFFLKAMWDPYGNTEDMAVAVVNKDEEAVYKGKTLHIGEDLVGQLREDDNLGWNFVSEEEAKDGLKNRKYYMIVTIPEDFSKNASTVMDENPQKMSIDYETNGALNYIAEIISKNAIKQLKTEVSAKVTEVYAKAIFDQMTEVGDGFQEAADGAGDLNEGADKILEGSGKVSDNLKKLADSTLTFQDGEESLYVGLGDYLEGVNDVNDGIVKVNDGVRELDGKIPELASGVTKLTDGSDTLKKGVTKYTGGVSALEEGTKTLADNADGIGAGVGTLVTSVSGNLLKMQMGEGKLLDGLTSISKTIDDKVIAKKDSFVLLEQSLPALNNNIQQLNASLSANNTNISTSRIVSDLTSVGTSTASIGVSASAIGEDAQKLNAALSGEKETIISEIEKTQAYASLDEEGKAELVSALNGSISTGSGSAGGYIKDITEQTKTIGASAGVISISANDCKTALSGISSLGTTMQALKYNVSKLAAASDQLLPASAKAISSLYDGIMAIKAPLDTQIIPGMKDLQSGLMSLQTGLSGGSAKLSEKLGLYLSGVKKAEAGASKLKESSGKLNSGATDLTEGLNTLNGKIPALKSGVDKLSEGTTDLAEGSATLVSNNAELMDGATKLKDGSVELADGSQKLLNGSLELTEAMGTMSDGSEELATKLADGSKKINEVQTTEKTTDMIAEPVTTNQEKYSQVPNYGHALAPYMLSLALFIGCMMFNYIYPIRKIADKSKTAFEWWLSKMSVGITVAVAMAVIECTVMKIIGLATNHTGEFFLITIVTAIAYMFLIMFFAMAFDNIGRFITMVLLVLQLSASGGTFPVTLSGLFFQDIHPYLPMTYSINGFRQAISSGLGTRVYVQGAGIMLGIAVAFQILLFLAMFWLKREERAGISQLDDNQKLLDDNYTYC